MEANSQPVATTLAEQYIDLIKAAFDRWERQVKGSPTWDDINRLMEGIFKAINAEGSHG